MPPWEFPSGIPSTAGHAASASVGGGHVESEATSSGSVDTREPFIFVSPSAAGRVAGTHVGPTSFIGQMGDKEVGNWWGGVRWGETAHREMGMPWAAGSVEYRGSPHQRFEHAR